MEVHHHAHSARRKWTHYFWEFFMLFLAVTLGFFVENQREHYVEHLREKQYAKSLYQELKSDTFWIEINHKEKLWAIEKLDSLKEILSSPAKIASNNELIYYFERFIGRHTVFTGDDKTYRQLLSSGNFRYFKNLALNKKISNYYISYDRYHEIGEAAYENANDLTELEARIFNGKDLASLTDLNGRNYYGIFKRPGSKLQPINTDPRVLSAFHIKIDNSLYALNASKRFLERLKSSATEAIEQLKKEYHFE